LQELQSNIEVHDFYVPRCRHIFVTCHAGSWKLEVTWCYYLSWY